MQKAAVVQASITKSSKLAEPWYDHGDFTVLCASGLAAMWFLIVSMDSRKASLS
ncbi:hypothetical protein R7041_16010 [Vibrio sp. 1751]|uniref:hypothetical protein n=1 Tax=unclassified Vibrio TaxID=2614977 RepID=UPI0029641A3C|nr:MULTISPECIES: hypothetical protein [unclassified Vibrio]MDW2098842.1 hypothetical protein [Vibrio sp. 1751]MDW2243694.1 hypothetical protein [Vibrio sp. 1287]